MTVKEKLFSVELTEDEISILTDALNNEYRLDKADYERDGGHMVHRHMEMARSLRNTFAGLIGKAYMGEDA